METRCVYRWYQLNAIIREYLSFWAFLSRIFADDERDVIYLQLCLLNAAPAREILQNYSEICYKKLTATKPRRNKFVFIISRVIDARAARRRIIYNLVIRFLFLRINIAFASNSQVIRDVIGKTLGTGKRFQPV